MRPEERRVPRPMHPKPERILPSHLAPNTLSVVVFGPGHGEAIIVVLPDGTVGVIDGCREPTTLDPVREFLNELEQDPSRQGHPLRLRFVCMTHPHEDHYRGLWRLLEAYQGRVDHVWRTQDVGDRYVEMWIKYLKFTRRDAHMTPDPDDVEGLTRLVTEMRQMHKAYGAKFRQLQQGMILMEGESVGHHLRISACGPSSADLETAQINLLGTLRGLAGGEQPPALDPNAVSGALVVRWGRAGVLLGGDLLCGKSQFQGWDEVHEEIDGPIQVVKAAHHASLGAHHEGLWQRLRPELTIVTPFLHAHAEQPPRPEQIDRLAQDSVIAITAVPKWSGLTSHPQPLFAARSSTQTTGGVTSGGFANTAMAQVPTAGEVDAHNAVAVSLDARGKLVRFVLAGDANVYEPLARRPP